MMQVKFSSTNSKKTTKGINITLYKELNGSESVVEELKDPSTYSQVLLNEIRPNYEFGYKPTSIFQYSANSTQVDSPFSKSPIGENSQKLLSSTKIVERKINRSPFKILRAPEIIDDFYLNLVDWSSQNILAVGLANSVYLWNASTNQVSKLCSYEKTVTSVSWVQRVFFSISLFNLFLILFFSHSLHSSFFLFFFYFLFNKIVNFFGKGNIPRCWVNFR